MAQKIKIKTGSIEETLLLPLWGRAYETQKNDPRLIDERAVEIIQRIDYDFSDIEKTQAMSQHGWVARSLHTDRVAREFIKKHPEATIVNIGCGMDTTFSRIENETIMFYELDLPDVIELRKNFYEDGDRHKSIASSFLDT
ncbi:class I SAM-dependent methyltransferase [Prosthecochloris sp.]|uniref:class I SAM-dependent methyltransferase n=1 Tax=Prosthecochloris sp. TaxID=290513 RepID=UPI0025801F62|nr:class I SAM-dependent methyltransferase [Prosthecochloris sp.]